MYRKGPLSRVVCFHRIERENLKAFREKLVTLKLKYNIVGLREIFNEPLLSRVKTNIAITFDDGFRELSDWVIEVLRELEVPAAVFLPSGFVNLGEEDACRFSSERIGIPVAGCLTAEEVRELSNESMVTIGGHTRSHADVGCIENIDTLKSEIIGCKKDLEEITGCVVTEFAYPYGCSEHFSDSTMFVLKEGGFRMAFTIIPGFNFLGSDRFRLHRDCLDSGMGVLLFKAWLDGGYDVVKGLIEKRKQLFGK
jgi:peptidoglycan/xylan/chitin deacetylase (PgdA/CDA1 family)